MEQITIEGIDYKIIHKYLKELYLVIATPADKIKFIMMYENEWKKRWRPTHIMFTESLGFRVVHVEKPIRDETKVVTISGKCYDFGVDNQKAIYIPELSDLRTGWREDNDKIEWIQPEMYDAGVVVVYPVIKEGYTDAYLSMLQKPDHTVTFK